MSSFIVFVIVLGVLITAHEFGHFIVAKWCGVGVVRFSIGFGPAFVKFRIGETHYQLCLIPLGGYVRMVGDIPDMITGNQETDKEVRKEDEDKEVEVVGDFSEEEKALFADRTRWFIEKPVWQRSAIVFAGPFFNFLLAWFLVMSSVILFGEEYVDTEPRIGAMMPGYPAAESGMKEGDLVTTLNDFPVSSWEYLSETIRMGNGSDVELHVRRGSEELDFVVAPKKMEGQQSGEQETVYLIGIAPSMLHRDVGVGKAFVLGASWTWNLTLRTCAGLWGIVRGEVSPKELAGPVFIFQEASRQAERGLERILLFMAILSISLAVLNLLPIPVLDGGHLLFFLIEATMGPISIRKREFAQQIGLVSLLFLMGFAIYNDISRSTSSSSDSSVESHKQKVEKDSGGPVDDSTQP